MAVSYTKKGKLLFIVQEFEKREDRYNINGIDRERAKYFARTHQGQFNEIPLGNYRIAEQGNQFYLLITNPEYLATIERLQVCYEFASISSDYEVEFEVDINTLKNKYNQLVTDVKNLFKYVQTNMMTADALDVFNVLPKLDADEVWVKTEDGWRGLNIGNLEANIQGLLDEMKARYDKYMVDIRKLGDGYEKDISHMGNTFKREMTEIKNANYEQINGLGTKYKTDIQSMGEMYLGNIAGSFEREVLQGKADIDKHTDEKLDVLDSSTALDLQELENKKTACIGELNKHTGDKKVELQLYEQELENQLAEFPALKKSEIDNYINNTSLPSIDLHTATKVDSIDDHVLLKKGELDTYEKAKEGELDAYNKTNIGKYDTEIREGLSTYQMFLVNEMDAHAKEVTTPKVQEIVNVGVENARSQVAGEVAKVTAEGDKQVVRVAEEGQKQIDKLHAEGLGDKQDKTDGRLQTSDKTVVGAINELHTRKLDSTGGLVSGELDFDTNGRNAIRMMMSGDVKGYVYPFEEGVTFAGNREQTSGITVNNRLNKTIANHGFVVKDTLQVQDFLNKNEYASIQYHHSEQDEPFKALTFNNVEHMVLHDGLSHFKVYTEKNLDINSKLDVVGGELTGDLAIRKAGSRSLKFLEDSGNLNAELTSNDDGSLYLKNVKADKGVGIDVRGKIGLNSNGVLSNNSINIKASEEFCQLTLATTENPDKESALVRGNDNVALKVNSDLPLNYFYDNGNVTINAKNLDTNAKDVIGAINEINAKGIDTSTLVKKTGDTMTGNLTIGTNDNPSRARVVGNRDTLALAVANDESNYITFVKNNASSSLRKAWLGFGDSDSNAFTIYNDVTKKRMILTSDGLFNFNGAIQLDNNITQIRGNRDGKFSDANLFPDAEMAISWVSGWTGNTSPTNYFPKKNNANGILNLNTHSGGYGSQLGFSSNGNIYHRTKEGAGFTGGWSPIWENSNCPISASKSSSTSGPYMSGYSKLANGLITQWGYTTINANSKTQVTLPTSFDSQYYSVSYDVPAQSEFNKTVYLDRWGSGYFTMNNQTKHKYTMFWLAIGKGVQ